MLDNRLPAILAENAQISSLKRRPFLRSAWLIAERQGDPEGRAGAGGALDFDPAAVGLDDLAGDVEAQAEAAVVGGRDRSLELAEDALDLGGRQADAAIADL